MNTQSPYAIETEKLTKDYGDGRGCHDITLAIRPGEAFGFLGPNGAGKSTFVKMLIGLIRPTSGTAKLLGAPAGSREAKKQIGYLPELFRYQEWLSGEEVLTLHARLSGLSRSEAIRKARQLLEEVGIGKRGKDRVKHYSKGMQQRLGLACALINDPKIVFLDEPASALDPIGRHEVRTLLGELKLQGKTIFLNTHLLEDVEQVCDRVALLHQGQILAQGTVEEVLREKARWCFRVGGLLEEDVVWLKEMSGCDIREAKQRKTDDAPVVWLETDLEEEEQVAWLNHLIVERGLHLYEVKKESARLNDWFISSVLGQKQKGEQD